MELIDREDICSVDICRDKDCEKCLFFQPGGVCLLRARVFKLKTVDAVPVVRCKDCKHWWRANRLCVHPKHCDGVVACHEVGKDDFCSDGERKTFEKGT